MTFMTLIYVLFILAAFSLLYWGVTQFALPQPMKVILIVVFGLIGLAVLWNLLSGSGGVHLSLR